MDSVRPPAPRSANDRDNVVVMRNLTWAHYEALLQSRGASSRPRLAYLDGELEVMTTSRRHELAKKLIARLLEIYAVERGVELIGAGETTFRREPSVAGLEPDECYFVGELKEVPAIALEIVHTSGGVDKLEIYRRLGVPEVWFWIEGRFWLYALGSANYREVRTSGVLRDLDLEQLARIVVTTEDDQQTTAVRTYQRLLQS